WDHYEPYPAEATNPHGPATGGKRIIRGGSWLEVWEDVRVPLRTTQNPATRTSVTGIRLARTVGCPHDEPNACGGCAALDTTPGEPCGPCGLDRFVCSDDNEYVECSGASFNGCG